VRHPQRFRVSSAVGEPSTLCSRLRCCGSCRRLRLPRTLFSWISRRGKGKPMHSMRKERSNPAGNHTCAHGTQSPFRTCGPRTAFARNHSGRGALFLQRLTKYATCKEMSGLTKSSSLGLSCLGLVSFCMQGLAKMLNNIASGLLVILPDGDHWPVTPLSESVWPRSEALPSQERSRQLKHLKSSRIIIFQRVRSRVTTAPMTSWHASPRSGGSWVSTWFTPNPRF